MKNTFAKITGVFAFVFILCFAHTGVSTIANAATHPSDAVSFGGHYYYKYESDMNWSDAEEYCEKMGGHLAVISSKEENDFIKGMLKYHNYAAYWLGAKRTAKGWEWVNGEPFKYNDFWNDQPDDDIAGMVLQMWYRDYYPNILWGWDDTYNDGDHGVGEVLQGFICEWDVKEDWHKTVVMNYLSGAKKDDTTYFAEMRESYFVGSNSTKVAENGLLRLSALAALTTYADNDKGGTAAFLKEAGFTDIKKVFSGDGSSDGASTKKDNDHGTVYCGYHDMKNGERLYAFILNGYSAGGYEWISNFNVGTASIHEGFDLAAEELAKIASEYIKKNSSSSTPKVWITGHSRGGALTNLLAIKLIENKGNRFDSRLTTSNVFAYGFATPQYTSKSYKGYGNCIINYVSPHDFVPNVVPSAWGFKRAGTNITFKNASAMKTTYKKMTGHKYRGYTTKQRKSIVSAFNDFGKNQKTYVNGYTCKHAIGNGVWVDDYVVPQDFGMYGIGMAMVDNSADSTSGISTMLTTANADKLVIKLAFDKTLDRINDSHEMMAYISWIDADYD